MSSRGNREWWQNDASPGKCNISADWSGSTHAHKLCSSILTFSEKHTKRIIKQETRKQKRKERKKESPCFQGYCVCIENKLIKWNQKHTFINLWLCRFTCLSYYAPIVLLKKKRYCLLFKIILSQNTVHCCCWMKNANFSNKHSSVIQCSTFKPSKVILLILFSLKHH